MSRRSRSAGLGPADRAVEPPSAVAAYRRALPEGEVLAFPLDPLDHLGVPTWSTELFAGAVMQERRRLRDERRAGPDRGLRRALRIPPRRERHQGDARYDAPRTRRSRRTSAPMGSWTRWRRACTAGSDYTPEATLRWVEARRWGTDEPVLVPLELAAASTLDVEPEGEWLVLPVNNGLGAGPYGGARPGPRAARARPARRQQRRTTAPSTPASASISTTCETRRRGTCWTGSTARVSRSSPSSPPRTSV